MQQDNGVGIWMYRVFCHCGWHKDVGEPGVEVGIFCKEVGQLTTAGCPSCGNKKLLIKNRREDEEQAA